MFKTTQLDYVTIKQGDPLFTFQSGFTLVPRASLEIDVRCPAEYHRMITTAWQKGWLRVNANIEAKKETWLQIKG